MEKLSSSQSVSLVDLENTKAELLERLKASNSDSNLLIKLANLDIKEAESIKKEKLPVDISSFVLEAKKLFYIAITMGNNVTPHYGLFKVAILEEDYFEAFCHLKAYETKLKSPTNFNLAYKLLQILLGNSVQIKSFSSDYIQDRKVEYEPLLKNYHLAELAFEMGDYQKMLKHLSICKTLADRKESNIDFSAILDLANTVFSIYRENQKRELRLAYANSSDIGERMSFVHKLIKLDDTDVESIFLLMDTYIDLKAYTPLVECIQKIRDLESSESQKESLTLYERLTSEIFMESLNLKMIYIAMEKGSRLQKEGLYSEAIAHYEENFNVIQFPYYFIQKAEAYYAMKNYDQAIFECNEYLKDGYLHYVEASILLYKSYRKKGDLESSFRVALECYKKARMRERGISFDTWMTRLNNNYDEKEGQNAPKRYIIQSSLL